ncbi:endonuclease [Mycoplasma sp. 1018B]|uniref:endonuclease n=1 Tax=Mycoplasma sp. 1018B TaxID=2967302 RepID=UPI0035941BF3
MNKSNEILSKYIYDNTNNYYASAEGKRGIELWNELVKIQKNKRNQIGSYSDLYDIYRQSDIDQEFENDGTIVDIYSENPNGEDPYSYNVNNFHGRSTSYGGGVVTGKKLQNGEGSRFNREHVIPQSWFNRDVPTRHDPHFVLPTDEVVNARRGNDPHDNVDKPTFVSLNGTKVKDKVAAEPIDGFKGNVARIYFYFQLTHGNGYAQKGSQVFSNAFPFFQEHYLNTYLEWANKDQVEKFEIKRNNVISKYFSNKNTNVNENEGLRNPFIDYPNLPELIWGNGNETFVNKGVLVGLN